MEPATAAPRDRDPVPRCPDTPAAVTAGENSLLFCFPVSLSKSAAGTLRCELEMML